jgi:p24 family protein beta-1
MMSKTLLCGVAVLALLSLSLGLCDGFSFQIDAHREECFIENVREGRSVGIRFQVTAGGFLDVDVRITGPDNLIIYSGERENEGKYSFVAHASGAYSFCFSNQMSTLTPKTVSLTLNVGEEDNKGTAATKETLTPLENSILQLSDGLTAIAEEQEYIKIRERVHRDTSESTNSRVVWWTFFEAFWLIGISVWQIVSLRRVFEQQRIV